MIKKIFKIANVVYDIVFVLFIVSVSLYFVVILLFQIFLESQFLSCALKVLGGINLITLSIFLVCAIISKISNKL